MAHFDRLSHTSNKPELYILSRFYLVRHALAEKQLSKAQEILKALPEPTQEPLQKELAFLKGDAAFQGQNYLQAVGYFKEALPSDDLHAAPWKSETLYNLGWSYIKLAESGSDTADQKEAYLKKAEETFLRLVAEDKDERLVLGLAHVYLTRGNVLKDPDGYANADIILAGIDAYEE